jgi:hypothetical protein
MAKTLADYLHFDCCPETLGTDIKAKALEAKLLPVLGPDGDGKGTLADFVFLLAHTTAATFTFDGTEKPALIEFKATWERRATLTPDDLWAWRLGMPWSIVHLWQESWLQAQNLFEVPVEQLPTAALTPEQQEEAKRPDSPLPSSAVTSLTES